MMDLQTQAEEFRHCYEVKNSVANRQMQRSLVREEFNEFLHATSAMFFDEGAPEDALKELADLVYVCFQYAENEEWDLSEALNRVHASNMSKLGSDRRPIRREDGKILKGSNYQPPDLKDLCTKTNA